MASEASEQDEKPETVPAAESSFQLQESMARAINYYDRLENLLAGLENRVRNLDGIENQKATPSNATERSDGPDASNTTEEVGKTTVSDTKPASLVPKVRECDWEHFTNRFNKDDRSCMIDVLVAGYQLRRDVAAESDKRSDNQSRQPRPLRVHRIETNSQWIQRIRIHSQALLGVFTRVTGYAWGTKPHTFVRPFQYLIHFHEDFKAELNRLELLLSHATCQQPRAVKDPVDVQHDGDSCSQKAESEDNGDVKVAESVDEGILDELRCYVNFAERKLIPQYNLYRHGDASSGLKIRFDDLWYLFRTGDLIYIPRSTLANATKGDRAEFRTLQAGMESHKSWMQQEIWRVSYSLAPEAEMSPSLDFIDDTADPKYFEVDCYYIDFDGSLYGAVERSFSMANFEGEKDITELEFYPLRYCHNANDMMKEHVSQGQKFVDWVSQIHAVYDGWSFVTDPAGIPIHSPRLTSGYKLVQEQPRHIEGEVIVDFKESIDFRPDYKPLFTEAEVLTIRVSRSKTVDSPDSIIDWSDSDRSRMLSHVWESVITNDDCDILEAHSFLQNDRYLRASERTTIPPVGEDLALLPPRVFVYALRLRIFVPVHCCNLNPVPVQQEAFAQLQLPEGHKRMIQAAVHSHLRKSRIEKDLRSTSERQIRTQDFIRGKGTGLIILLHGEPGVGKTATAEAVAQWTRRPLFSLAGNSLYGNSLHSDIEANLEDIFRLAHLWECVLLMDEADVFLSSRSGNSVTGSLVSIFLRRLEYYSGVLFLTTNRIGKLDPALGSRIHLIVHYKRLGQSEIENIFSTNIERLKQMEQQQHEVSGAPKMFIMEQDILKFAADHYKKHPKGKGAWNGRQIRNAFVIAASLARYEAARYEAEQPGLAGTGFQPQLRYSHFQEVEKLTDEYNRFRTHVLGGDDSRKAFLNEERDDDFGDNDDEEKVSDIVNRMNLARYFYMGQQQGQAQSHQGNPGANLATYTQPPQQQIPVHYNPPHMNQSQHQFSPVHETRSPGILSPSTMPSQNQGGYIFSGVPPSNAPRPSGED